MTTSRQRSIWRLAAQAQKEIESWPQWKIRRALQDLPSNDSRVTPRAFSLKEVLKGCERASERVSQWPQWKKNL